MSLGKNVAVLATFAFGYVTTEVIFYIFAGTCFVAFFFTLLFSADYTHVSLSERDAQLELFIEGRPEAYKGRLNKRKHLSNYELWTGRHGEYDLDFAYNLVDELHASGGYHQHKFDVTKSVVQAGGLARKSIFQYVE